MDLKKFEHFTHLAQSLKYQSEHNPNQDFIIYEGETYSFKNINDQVNKCLNWLSQKNLQQGDRLTLVLKNSVEYVICFLAANRMGVTVNPFPFHLSDDEIIKNIGIISPKLTIAHSEKYQALEQSIDYVFEIPSTENFFKEIDQYPSESQDITIDPQSDSVLYYSSGTTGAPKILRYSHHSQLRTMESLVRGDFIRKGDTHICILPLGHTAGIRYTFLPCLYTGSRFLIYDSFWKIRTNLFEIIEEYQVNFFEIVPSILSAILNTPYPKFNKEQIRSIRFVGCGSSYLPYKQQVEFIEKYGIKLANLYGLSETGPTHFDNPLLEGWKPGTIGNPIDIIDCVIVDDEGKPVAEGIVGEAAVKGDCVFSGYLNNDELFENSLLPTGHFLTGDLVKFESGNFHYIDRKKDLIIKGGVNIVPGQIDNTIQELSQIKEAATVGIPDKFMGEEIKSFVVLRDGQDIGEAEIRSYCLEKLGKFKAPRYVELTSELPKGPSGKILKRKLRQQEKEKYEATL